MSTPTTPVNGGAGGGTTYDPFTYVDPSATNQDSNPVPSGTMYSVPTTTDFTGAQHVAYDGDGPINISAAPVISKVYPLNPLAGQYGTLEGSGLFGHVPQLFFVPKGLFSGTYGTPIPVPCNIESDGIVSFGPLPSTVPSNKKGGKWVYSNHRGSAQTPVCDPSNVTGYSPTHGSPGDRIHILGTFGAPVDDVVFGGGVHADKSTIINDPNGYYVSVVVPNGAVTGPLCIYCDQTCSGADDCGDTSNPFVVDGTCPTPYVSGFSPTGGVAGTHVTIYGQNFTGATRVQFGIGPSSGQDAASYTVQDAGTITCIAPQGVQSGHIKVTTPCGADSSDTWWVVGGGGGGAPVIDSLTPNPCPQGVPLTIYGQGFGNLSPQGGVKYVSGNSTFFLNGHWTVQNGGTQIVVDGQGTFSLPKDTQGKIVVTNVAGQYDEHDITITKFNPKVVISGKAPYFANNLIVGPGAVISTSPPADVVDVPGILGITAVAGLAASDLLQNTMRTDHYTNPPGSFTTPAKTTKGVAIPYPHPFNRANQGTATATWTRFGGKVIDLSKFRVEKAALRARTTGQEKDYASGEGCIKLLVEGPLWNEGRNEVFGTWYIFVTDARCDIIYATVVWKLMLGDMVVAQKADSFSAFSDPRCAKKIEGTAWANTLPGQFGNAWTFGVAVDVEYYDQNDQQKSWTQQDTRGNLNCGDAEFILGWQTGVFGDCGGPS